MNNLIVSLSNVSKTYLIRDYSNRTIKSSIKNIFKKTKKQKVKALKNINLEIKKGERVGIIGRNGSGKSTLLNIIMGSLTPEKGGTVITQGSMMKLSLGMGMDPNLTARENIYVNGSVIGLSFKKIGMFFDEIIAFAEIEEFVDTPVKFFSSGMKQRLMFSIALYAKADTFLLDEFFGGTGDKNFRLKSDKAFTQHIIENHTVIIVSHSMAIISKYCTKAVWLEKGIMKANGPANEIINLYNEHDYNKNIN